MNDPARADLGFAQLDLARQQRCGFPEVIYGEGKSLDALIAIVKAMQEAGQNCFVTRVNEAQSHVLAENFPTAKQNRTGRTFWHSIKPLDSIPGKVVIVTAGTADLPVAHEALETLQAMGVQSELIADVGVAGLHRVLSQLDRIRQADVVIVVAGMEAALASVVGGLVAAPVIAVPTSVGYGTNFKGMTALLGMLNSCAANVVVVNIDAGFKAGYVAGLMLSAHHRKSG